MELLALPTSGTMGLEPPAASSAWLSNSDLLALDTLPRPGRSSGAGLRTGADSPPDSSMFRTLVQLTLLGRTGVSRRS